MFNNFDKSACVLMARANAEAIALGHEFIGTEHVLLAILSMNVFLDDNPQVDPALAVIAKFTGVPGLRAEVLKRSTPETSIVICGKCPMTPRVKKCLEFATAEALKEPDGLISSRHILLGLMLEGDSVAAASLLAAGITEEELRAEFRIPSAA